MPHKKYPVPDFDKFRSVCLEQWLLYSAHSPDLLSQELWGGACCFHRPPRLFPCTKFEPLFGERCFLTRTGESPGLHWATVLHMVHQRRCCSYSAIPTTADLTKASLWRVKVVQNRQYPGIFPWACSPSVKWEVLRAPRCAQ